MLSGLMIKNQWMREKRYGLDSHLVWTNIAPATSIGTLYRVLRGWVVGVLPAPVLCKEQECKKFKKETSELLA